MLVMNQYNRNRKRRKRNKEQFVQTALILFASVTILAGIVFLVNCRYTGPGISSSLTGPQSKGESNSSSISGSETSLSGSSGSGSESGFQSSEISSQLSSFPASSTQSSQSEWMTPTPFPSVTPVPTITKQPTATIHPTATPSHLPNVKYGWYPGISATIKNLCVKYDGIWQGDTTKKKIYITMDAGYEYNNNTTKILDIAKSKNFKISFFIAGGAWYKTEALKSVVLRMDREGHLVGSHTWNHPSLPDLYAKSGAAGIITEIRKNETAYFNLTGHAMPLYLRPPSGQFSEAVLSVLHMQGYRTVFWGYGYVDWLTADQPDPTESKKLILDHVHNGTVLLLHTVSNTNVAILPGLVDELRNRGYEISLLTDLP